MRERKIDYASAYGKYVMSDIEKEILEFISEQELNKNPCCEITSKTEQCCEEKDYRYLLIRR